MNNQKLFDYLTNELGVTAMSDQLSDICRITNESQWILVKEQKPDDYQRVLFYDSRDGNVNLGYFVWSQTPVLYVTHWMPLPAPPN